MCGRYALSLRPSQVRRILENDNVPVYDAPEDEGAAAPRQSYNFAPGYHGIVYRADVPEWGAGPSRGHHGRDGKQASKSGADSSPAQEDHAGEAASGEAASGEAASGEAASGEAASGEAASGESTIRATELKKHKCSTGGGVETGWPGDVAANADVGRTGQGLRNEHRYILQTMKWGLIPFWTKRKADYASMLKTINCRDDSLAQPGGMWSTMKARKRCVVVAQGFYEWLKPHGPGSREKVPHHVRRADGRLMCFAGLWDCVRYEDEDEDADGAARYTYTIITTDSNEQLKFLHDRMPVILDQASEEMGTWLNPGRYEWSAELQALLRPYAGRLETYPVSQEVGKVGNDSPNFIIPVASKENKGNIANFFANAALKKQKVEPGPDVRRDPGGGEYQAQGKGMGEAEPRGIKRESTSPPLKETPSKRGRGQQHAPGRPQTSATNSARKSPAEAKGGKKGGGERAQKITEFFANSA